MSISGEEGLRDLLAVQEQIPKSGSLPVGRYRLNVVKAENLPATEQRKRQAHYTMQVVESLPAGFEGHEHIERFALGTETDPEAKDPQTLVATDNWGAMAWKRFRDVLGTGQQLCATVEGRAGNDGNVYNSLRALYPPSVKLSEVAAPSATPRQAKSKATAVVKPASTTFEVAQGVAEQAPTPAPVIQQGVMIPCGIPGCNIKVPRSQIIAHFQQHESAPAAAAQE